MGNPEQIGSSFLLPSTPEDNSQFRLSDPQRHQAMKAAPPVPVHPLFFPAGPTRIDEAGLPHSSRCLKCTSEKGIHRQWYYHTHGKSVLMQILSSEPSEDHQTWCRTPKGTPPSHEGQSCHILLEDKSNFKASPSGGFGGGSSSPDPGVRSRLG